MLFEARGSAQRCLGQYQDAYDSYAKALARPEAELIDKVVLGAAHGLYLVVTEARDAGIVIEADVEVITAAATQAVERFPNDVTAWRAQRGALLLSKERLDAFLATGTDLNQFHISALFKMRELNSQVTAAALEIDKITRPPLHPTPPIRPPTPTS